MLITVMIAVAAQAAAPATTPASEKKICRKNTEATGTIMPRRECHTKSEWAEIAKRNRASVDRLGDQLRGTGMTSSGR